MALGTTAERPAVSQAVMTDLEKQLDKEGFDGRRQRSDSAAWPGARGLRQRLRCGDYARDQPGAEAVPQSVPAVDNPFEAAQIHKRKLERLPLVRQRVHQLWMVAAAARNTMPNNDQIVVAVRLVYQEWEDTKGLPGLLVVKATRQDGLTGNLQTGEQ